MSPPKITKTVTLTRTFPATISLAGDSEGSAAAKKVVSEKINELAGFSDIQKNILLKTSQDYLSAYDPHVNGGYVILMRLGPWAYREIKSEHKLEEDFFQYDPKFYTHFESKVPTLAYSIDIGATTAESDSLQLRHHSIDMFSFDAKISQVSVTYLEDMSNIVTSVHDNWIKYMKYLREGLITYDYKFNPDSIFVDIPHVGEIWAYAYNPLDLTPKQIIKFIGTHPDSVTNQENFGSRDHTEHYMKTVSYKVADYRRDVYTGNTHAIKARTPQEKFEDFKSRSYLFKEFLAAYNAVVTRSV